MKFETIVYEKEGPIAWISLNRPEKLNAMTQLMVDELLLATDKAQCDDDIRVMILKGKGRAFSAGFDLEIVTDPDRTKEEELQELKNELHNDFERRDAPALRLRTQAGQGNPAHRQRPDQRRAGGKLGTGQPRGQAGEPDPESARSRHGNRPQ
jgi:hypothetical protein